jgi:diguanylate cyclase (GGDEF)-like protein
MRNYVHSRHHHNGKITIGLIPENSANEFENRMRAGIIEAAREHHVNLICFTQLETISKDSVSYGTDAERYYHIHRILRHLVDEFDIDGLLFLGWSILLEDEYFDDFQKHFAHIPILSLGKEYSDVPSVYCEGGIQISEMIRHLIGQHGHHQIAFVESWNKDNRIDYYIQTMQEYGLYDERLVISTDDLKDVAIPDRAGIALAILESRNVKFDVIIVMRADESRIMLEQLKLRGLRVPEDVALTSYEDDISIEFSDPPITTIYFPFREIGYMGCVKLVELLTYGEIPHTTFVPNHILIRNSCGCSRGDDLSRSHIHIDIDQELEESFRLSIEARNPQDFIDTLKNRLEGKTVDYNDYQRIVSLLRTKYSQAELSNSYDRERVESVCHSARLAISEIDRSWTAQQMIKKRRIEELLEQLSQSLLNTFSMPRILEIMEVCLRQLDIPSCNVFLCSQNDGQISFKHCTHIFSLVDHQRMNIQPNQVETRAYHNALLQSDDDSSIWVVSLLYAEQNSIGYITFKAGPIEGMLYLRLAILFSNAFAGAFNVDKLTSEISLRKEKELQLSYYAQFDTETGLLNRRAFYESVSRISLEQFCIIYFDLDGFKAVNDSFGHDVGDQVLREVAKRIKLTLQHSVVQVPTDVLSDDNNRVCGIFRIGGDEFTAIVEYSDIADVNMLAEQLIEITRQPCYVNHIQIMITCSVGISSYPLHTKDRNLLINYADTAMYYAKHEGGNKYLLFKDSMEEETNLKLEFGNDLRQALDNEELSLYYQPQVDVQSGTIVGVEALLRWFHPTKGAIEPSLFIPIAEEMGLIVPIGDWVLRQACEQMRLWQDSGLPFMRIAVNLSALQFLDGNLVEKVALILEDTKLDAKYLELEITENVAMKDEQLQVLGELRKLGIAIAIDDFGTEYSSLSYLKRFPVTKLKLDQSFIRGIGTDFKDREMIKAIIFVATSFDLEIVAEGVEQIEELQFLFENGCSQIQGFHFFKPMDAVGIEQIFDHSLELKYTNIGNTMH